MPSHPGRQGRTALARVGAILTLNALLSCSAPTSPPEQVTRIDLIAAFDGADLQVEAHRIDIGTPAARRFLTHGWSWNEKGKRVDNYVWSSGESSTISFFVATPRPLTIQLRGYPFSFPGSPAQSASVMLNGTPITDLELTGGWREYALQLPEESVRAGINDLQFRYAWSQIPAAMGRSQDLRRLAFAWDWVEIGSDREAPLPPRVVGETLVLPFGTQVEYFLELPPQSTLVAAELAGDVANEGALFISVTREGEEELEVARLSTPIESVHLPVGSDGGLVRLRFRAAPSDGTVRGNPLILKQPHILAPASKPSPEPPVVDRTQARVAGRPNVILYIVDTLRADRLGSYGYQKPTSPGLDSLVAEAILFESARAQSSWTRPSVASILTGLLPWTHRVNGLEDRLSEDIPSLPEILKHGGFTTGAVVSNPNISETFGFARGFDHFESIPNLAAPAHTILSAGLRWIDSLSPTTPFFLYLHTMEPHAPYSPPTQFQRQVAAKELPPDLGSVDALSELARRPGGPPPAAIADITDLYDAEIAYHDHELSRFLSELEKRDLYQETLTVLVSDHGEQFYEHGQWGHGKALHAEVLNVPLIIRLPAGTEGGKRIADPVQHIDVVPTILDYLDLVGPGDLPGRSLLPAMLAEQTSSAGNEMLRPMPIFAFGGFKERGASVILGDWKLIMQRPQAVRRGYLLYFRRTDPREEHNLAGEKPILTGYLSSLIRQELAVSSKLPAAERVEIDDETRRELEALGYLN